MPISITCSFCSNEVPQPSQCCPHCGRPGLFWNVVAAEESDERAALDRRYQAAKKDAINRKAERAVQEFENAMSESHAVIARSPSEVLRLASSARQLYATYYQMIEAELRLPDGDEWDALREPADTLLFPHYKNQIRFGALSLDGVGLSRYGSCSIVLREGMIAHRASLFEENSAVFVERHGMKKARTIKGYRSTWNDRPKLCFAKLHDKVDSTTTLDKYSRILLSSGVKPEDDEFVEVHIWGPLSVLTMERVIVIAPHASKRATIIRAIKSKLAKHNVQVN